MIKNSLYDRNSNPITELTNYFESHDLICNGCGKKISIGRWVVKNNEVMDYCALCIALLTLSKENEMKKKTKVVEVRKQKVATQKAIVGAGKPTGIEVNGTKLEGKSWRSCYLALIGYLIKDKKGLLSTLTKEMPSYIRTESKGDFRAPLEITGGFVEGNLSSCSIQTLVAKIAVLAGFKAEEVKFTFN